MATPSLARQSNSSTKSIVQSSLRSTRIPSSSFIQNCSFHSTFRRRKDDPNNNDGFAKPGPPPLPMKEQREFEKLVKENANKPQFTPASQFGDDKHPQYRAKPKAEFDGDTNPNTGEIGGPKNDPLKWEREWSYGGRATDF